MKKEILISTIVLIASAVGAILSGDGLLYLTAALMALSAIGIIRLNKSRVTKITRWAKANPIKTVFIIAVLQWVLAGMAVLTGFNLRALGLEISIATAFIFSGIMTISFFCVPFLPLKNAIAIPKEVNKHRLGYLSIILSGLIIFIFIGNRTGDFFPDSPLTRAIATVDHWIFSDGTFETNGLSKAEAFYNNNYGRPLKGESSGIAVFTGLKGKDKSALKRAVSPENLKRETGVKKNGKVKKNRKYKKNKNKADKKEYRKKLRRTLAAATCAGAILIIVLLSILICGGICLAIWGGAVISEGMGGVGALMILGGLGVVAGSAFGISKAGNVCPK